MTTKQKEIVQDRSEIVVTWEVKDARVQVIGYLPGRIEQTGRVNYDLTYIDIEHSVSNGANQGRKGYRL